jgi:alkyl hydroperoxide reductase subunit AhpC
MFGRLGVACLQEVPFLQKWKNNIKENIEFVSISVDNIKDREKWSNLVNKKQLGGIQLLADKDSIPSLLNNIAFKESKIYSDPNGNIVNSNAPRPSETELIDLFNELKI